MYFKRRFHDCQIRSLQLGKSITLGLTSESENNISICLENVVMFRARSLQEQNIVGAISFDPMGEYSLETFRNLVSSFQGPFDNEGYIERVYRKYSSFGLFDIEETLGMAAMAVCERVDIR